MTLDNLALRPNCLLTRSPLVFISGPRSLLSPQKMGTFLQDYLQAHGYQVLSPWMPFRSKKHRKMALLNWLEKNKAKNFHFVMAEETWLELSDVIGTFFHPHSTVTLVNLKSDPPLQFFLTTTLQYFKSDPTQAPLFYRLHTVFSAFMGAQALPYAQTLLEKNKAVYDRFLDHCIQLAENEYKDLTSRM